MEARGMIETKVTGAIHWAIQGLPRGGTATCMPHFELHTGKLTGPLTQGPDPCAAAPTSSTPRTTWPPAI